MPAAASTALRPAGSTPSSWMIGSVCQMVLPAFSSNALTDENIADIAAYLLSLNEAQTTAVVAAQAPTSPPPGGRPFPPAIRSMAVRSLRQIARCAMVRTHNKGALARHYTEKRPARKRQRRRLLSRIRYLRCPSCIQPCSARKTSKTLPHTWSRSKPASRVFVMDIVDPVDGFRIHRRDDIEIDDDCRLTAAHHDALELVIPRRIDLLMGDVGRNEDEIARPRFGDLL